MTITLYTKYDCRWCDMTKKVFDRDGVQYTAINVEDDADAYKYLTETLNRREMPTVVAGDQVWSGFQPAMIRQHITHRDA